MKRNKKQVLWILVLLFSSIQFVKADDDPEELPGDPGYAEAAPIDDYIPLMLIAAAGLALKITFDKRRKEKMANQ